MNATMPERKKPEAKKELSQLGISIKPEIREAMDAFIADFNAQNEHRATITSTVEAALKMYLAAKKFWPPK